MKTTDLITLQKSITQGEWRADLSPGSFRAIQSNGDMVARVSLAITIANSNKWQPDTQTTEANAQAIAITPQLIAEVIRLREALTSCLDWMEFTIPRLNTTPSGSIERMNYGGPINKARTALENT